MISRLLILVLAISLLACKSDKKDSTVVDTDSESDMVFDKEKWRLKEGKDYVYRERMFRDVIYNDTIRSLNKVQLIDLLGEPDYYGEDNTNFMYYRIVESGLGFFTLKTQTMVVKFKNDKTMEWIKVHE
ncbi:MAG: hypothetical protein EX254_10060, partial [Flavobacteriaceae bacterium]